MKTIRVGAGLLTAASLLSLIGCGGRSNSQNALVTIHCEAPGMMPDEVASMVSYPLEVQLQSVPHVESVRSTSRFGQAVLWVEFARGADRMEARQAIAERLAAAEQLLPEGVVPALAPESSPGGIGFLIALSMPESGAADGEMRAVLLRTLAETSLRPKLANVPGVADVEVIGGMRKQVQIVADPEHLAAYDMTLAEFAEAIEEGLAAGPDETLVGSDAALPRGDARLEEIADLPVRVRDGAPVYVRDMAEVRIGGARADELSRNARRPSLREPVVMILVRVRADVNFGGASGQINLILAELRPHLPEGVRMERKIPSRLNQHVGQALNHLERDLPPETKLEHLRTKEFGSVVRTARAAPIAVKAFGPDMAELHEACRKIETEISKVSGITNVRIRPQDADLQPEIHIDRERLSALDVKAVSLTTALEIALDGLVVGKVQEQDDRIDVVVRLHESTRSDISQIGQTRLRASAGELFRLADVAEIRMATSISELHRANGLFLCLVLCDAGDRQRDEALTEIRQRLSEYPGDLPAGVILKYR
jgi:Cu/Ag efflux pump CusA